MNFNISIRQQSMCTLLVKRVKHIYSQVMIPAFVNPPLKPCSLWSE